MRVYTELYNGKQDAAADEESIKEMVNYGLPVCSGAVIAYQFAQLRGMALDTPNDISKAPDEATKNFWSSKSVASDIKKCADRGTNYTDFLACSCVAGANFGSGKVTPSGDDQKKQSTMTESRAICRHMSEKFAELDGPAGAARYRDFPKAVELLKMRRAEKAGDYATAFATAQHYAAATEADEIKDTGSAGKKTAGALASVGWHGLFAQKFAESLDASDRALALTPSDLVPTTNRAHALMFLGRTEEARAIYRAHVGEPLQDKKWENVIVEDFAKLRAANLTNPLMAEIEAALPPSPAPTATESATSPSPTPTPTPTPSPVAAPQPTPTPTPTTSALATPEPSPTPAPLRTPPNFDCKNGKHMGTDWVICASPELLDAEARLEEAYGHAHASLGDAIQKEQWDWIKRYGPDCGLPLRGRPRDDQIHSAAGCVRSAIEKRISQLDALWLHI